ncbi:thioredoxin domain-containing protein [Trichormus variabilis]|uniref:Thioredoxin domain-containing protein n=1 Tax=Trichormus variabilis SAG 1403-4b TaxID=447716 RepID=A0A3S1ANW0_ANAVA|nr:thioredoxin domain-containing protein [Trichormus variabilis]MBD2628399.1 thioredoxin domain-containing protein [Trichormus variabilis FACHB-164]RUS96360.1 thioredoxin domain-containing protein [Trichormus variabilis SAG 1403-4b]
MTNRLAEAKSLYLRKHAENPIDWWSWCDEALATAREQDKPIFLSIGYSSCHWCTVMEGEAFSDLAIAEYMNANFLPIKVDREERPDLDSIYMQTLQMMSGQGGWPLNVFLSPDDLVPFYAGTYFPVDPRYGRPGFLQVLQALRRYYDTEKEELRQRKALVVEALLTSAVLQNSSTQETEDQELLLKGGETSTGIIIPKQVGNSFPMIPYAEFALRGTRFNYESQYDRQQVCTQRGLDLVLGGIYDHVGGGFHRYTVDPTWTVPHFEKMLYDNGQIIEYLGNLWSAGIQEPAFERAVAGTIKWLQREMTAPTGYFYAAQDADSFTHPTAAEPEEGAFYVWRYSELEQLLTSAELTELQQNFTVTANGNFEGQNVLQRLHQGELSQTLEISLSKLFAARYGSTPETLTTFPAAPDNQEAKTTEWPGRIPAVTDTKMIVAWNSLMISGLARAAVVFGQPSYLELAAKAANFILDNQFIDGRFYRLNYQGEASVLAQSEDYAFFIKALLDLHQASLRQIDYISTQDSELSTQYYWLEKAVALQEEFNEFLWSVELGGYFNTASDNSQDLIVRERSYIDNATPSANGIAIANLVRLSLLTDNLHYLDLAEQGLRAFRGVMNNSPQACPSLFTALDWYRNSTLIRSNREQLTSLIPKYLPTTVLAMVSELPEGSVGLVCQGLKCLPAAGSVEELLLQVQRSQIRM